MCRLGSKLYVNKRTKDVNCFHTNDDSEQKSFGSPFGDGKNSVRAWDAQVRMSDSNYVWSWPEIPAVLYQIRETEYGYGILNREDTEFRIEVVHWRAFDHDTKRAIRRLGRANP